MKKTFRILLLVVLTANIISCDYENGMEKSSYYNDSFYSSEDSYNEKYEDYGENPFILTVDKPVSTFSIDADGASYSNSRRYIELGQAPPTSSVRVEEYINYFNFDYDDPSNGENVSLNSEISTCPWEEDHYLMRIGMKGKSIPENEIPNSNYVFLIDVSGSMNSPEKLGVLKTGFKLMADNLKDQDKVAIVTYAGNDHILLESTYGDDKSKIKNAIDQLGASGSTAGSKGIETAYEIAQKHLIPNGNNRVILGSDGDFNVGITDQDELIELIEEKRELGIYLTVLGVGGGNLNDQMMEQLANNGNGNYEYIDNADQIEKVFVNEKSKFFTVAKDAKIQITFDTNRIESYRLIGYENRALNNEDFTNDSADAGEIGANQTITALYEINLTKNKIGGKYAQFDFRYKKPDESSSILIQHTVINSPVDISNSSENMRFAVAVAGFGLITKESSYKGDVSKKMIIELGVSAISYDPFGYKEEFIDLVEMY